jgi:predicted N-acyltransferase
LLAVADDAPQTAWVSVSSGLRLKVLDAISEVPAAAWDALLLESDRPFLCWAYLDALEKSEAIAPLTGWKSRHFTLWEGEALVAAAPAYLKSSSGGEYLFDGAWARAADRLGIKYLPKLVLTVPLAAVPGRRLLVRSGDERHAQALLEQLIAWAREEQLSSVHFHFADPPLVPRLETKGFVRRLSVQYVWENAGYASYDDFLLRFTARRRKQLKREARRVVDGGIEIQTLRGAGNFDPELAYRLYTATAARYAHGPKPLPLDFFHRLVAAFPQSVEFVCARKGGEVIAGALNLSAGERLFGRYWGALEPQPFLHFAACLYHPVEDCIALGRSRYNPGAGGEHKLTRGFTPTLVHSAHLMFDPQLEATVRDFLTHERAALEQGLPLWERETGFKHHSPT